MKNMKFGSRTVLVTGASSGLGWELAKQLAIEHGANVIPVARRSDRLAQLKHEIEAKAPVRVEPITADLSKLEEVERVFREATERGPLYAAALNAAVAHFGEYHELSWGDFQSMLATNVTGVVRLTMLLLPYLEARAEGGGLLIVSSMAGLTPVPYQTAYSATKSFLLNFGCGLWHETQGRNVSISTFVPGGIRTEMTAGERFVALDRWLEPADVTARDAIAALQRRAYLQVPGTMLRAGAALMGLVPRQFLSRRVAAIYRSALEAAGPRSR